MSGTKIKAIVVSLVLVVANGFAAQGLTVFHIGNSLTDQTYGMHTIAQGFGYTWSGAIYGRSMIPGCPLWLLWKDNVTKTADKTQGNCGFFTECTTLNGYDEWIDQKYPALWSTSLYLRTKPVDALILQIFIANGDHFDKQETMDGAIGYAGEAYKANPNCQVYIYPSHTMTVGGTNDLALLTTEFEPIARAVSAAYPTRKPVRVLPVLQVWNQMMSAGYTNLWLSATDGHANDNGKYILCTTLYTCLYKRNAAGAVTTGFTGVSAAFATKAQELAWSVAQSYPMSGVGTTAVIPNNTPATYRTAQQLLATDACAFDLTGRAVRGAQTSSGVPSARGVYFARTTSANGVSKVVKSGQPVNFK